MPVMTFFYREQSLWTNCCFQPWQLLPSQSMKTLTGLLSLEPVTGSPRYEALPSHLFQDVWWFREVLATKDEWRAPVWQDELFSHIYNCWGSPWQAPAHRPTPLSWNGISNTQTSPRGGHSMSIYLIFISGPLSSCMPVFYSSKAG